MEIKSITINNFLSYYGSNEIEFSPMTTIIIGQNNTGKSKLFDAINFTLYERVYDTEKESWLINEKEIAPLILNKHKIRESLQKSESEIIVSVTLILDGVSSENSFMNVERKYIYKLNENNYKFSYSNLTVTEIDKFDNNPIPYINSEAKDRLKTFFSSSIKDFFLFQGEAASKIMKLQKGGNFRQAVREIARLEMFEKAKEYAEKYESTISRSITMKVNKNRQNKQQQETLQLEIDNLQEQLDLYVKKKDEAEIKRLEYSEILEKNEDELSKLKEFENYFNQKKQIEENRKRIKRELDEINNEKALLAEDCVFYKIQNKINSFKEFYSKLEAKGEVPPSISPFEIKKAIDCCRCTICNTDLSEGTEARRFAESRLPKCDTDKLGDYLRTLNYTLGNENDLIQRVPEKLENLLERKRKLENKKNSLIKDDELLALQLETVQLDETSSKEKIQRANEVRQTISRYSTLLKKAEADLNQNEGSIRYIENQIFKKKKELECFITEDDEIDIEDKIKLSYSKKLNIAMKKLFEVATRIAYEQVEKCANEYYKDMTQENAALVGDIKIDLQTSEIYTVDEDGVRIININQGNRISIQLAVIAGILTVAQDQFGVQYPFVTDAPVSHLGGDNKKSTIETMVNAFEQSIIIIKDDISTKNKANDEIRKMIYESSYVECAYELSLSEAENINDQYTEIKKIKG